MCASEFVFSTSNMSQKDKEINTLNKLRSFFFRDKNASGKSMMCLCVYVSAVPAVLTDWTQRQTIA